MNENRTAGRRRFLLLVTLFAAPVVGAYLVYFFAPGMGPTATTNYGTLESPVRTLPEGALANISGDEPGNTVLLGKWSFVQVAVGGCDESCRANLMLTRQVRTSLNEKRARVQRLLVADSEELAVTLGQDLAADHPQLLVVYGNRRLLEFLVADPAVVQLLDPHANAVMRYLPVQSKAGVQADFKGLRKDIKKLLKLSNIG